MPDWDVIVIGGGAAGLLAATRAAERGRRTLLVEKNDRPGVKILMSGGTRCNLTHDCDSRGIIEAFGTQGKFLHSALAALGPRELVDLVEAEGVPTKVEDTGKVFPVSNKATDVLAALLRRLERSGCQLALAEPVLVLEMESDGCRVVTAKRALTAEKIIITTGGQSYPGSGTTGDGYAWAKKLGHTIVAPRPALVPLTVDATWVPALRGVTVPDVGLSVASDDGSILAKTHGSLLFAHFGLSGPAALDVSRVVSEWAALCDMKGTSKGDAAHTSGLRSDARLNLICDFLPKWTAAALDEHLRHASSTGGKRQVASILPEELPRRLAALLPELAGVDDDRRAAELSKSDRAQLVKTVKELCLPLTGTLGFQKAEVTAGGVALGEVDSRTMQSKLVPRLYLAGEVLDLDGPIGGYNFQAAFSTGWLAGESV